MERERAPRTPSPAASPPSPPSAAERERAAVVDELSARVAHALELASRLEAEAWEGPWQQARCERSLLGTLVGELSGAAEALERLRPVPRERPRRREPRGSRHRFVHEWL